jgi:hypothetical protein
MLGHDGACCFVACPKQLTTMARGFGMTIISIPLSDERLAQLRVWAEQAGVSPEEFLRRRVDQLLEPPDDRFRRAAAYVLTKNAELYRRLA